MKRVLDDSKDGFIYFSFGSLARVESFPRETFEKFYATFRKLAPVRVIMKSTEPKSLPKGLPNNVYTFPWFPQEEVLSLVTVTHKYYIINNYINIILSNQFYLSYIYNSILKK